MYVFKPFECICFHRLNVYISPFHVNKLLKRLSHPIKPRVRFLQKDDDVENDDDDNHTLQIVVENRRKLSWLTLFSRIFKSANKIIKNRLTIT